jgi:acid phosphatase family membrane protein YuiD
LLAAALLVPTLPGGGVADLFTNRVFMAGFAGWAVAQCLKVGMGQAVWGWAVEQCLNVVTAGSLA